MFTDQETGPLVFRRHFPPSSLQLLRYSTRREAPCAERHHQSRPQGGRYNSGNSTHYLAVTALLPLPPKLLRTVMFCGFADQLSSPPYLPPPLFDRVPMN